MVSIILVRWIIVSGPELWEWISETAAESLNILLMRWELDHAAFGFSFGIPMFLFTVFLLSIRYYSFTRMLLSTLAYYLLQLAALLIMVYYTTDILPVPMSDKTMVFFPNYWHINSVLITASFSAAGIVLGCLFLLKFSQQKSAPVSIDQDAA